MQMTLTWELFAKNVAVDFHGNIMILKHNIGIWILFDDALDKLIPIVANIHQVGDAEKDASDTQELQLAGIRHQNFKKHAESGVEKEERIVMYIGACQFMNASSLFV